MARDQQTDGIYLPIQGSGHKIDRVIQVGDGTSVGDDGRGITDLARNCNTISATRSPALVTQLTPGATDVRYTEVTYASDTDLWAWVLPVGGYGNRTKLLGKVQYYTTDGSTTGVFTLTAQSGGSDYTTLAASTTPVWASLNSIAIDTSMDADVIVAAVRRSAGSGEVRIRSIVLWVDPWAGELDPGVDNTDFEALDTIQWDADSPLSAGNLVKLAANHQALHDTYEAPYSCHCTPLEGTKGDSYTTASTSARMPVVPQIIVGHREGEGVTHVRYYIFPHMIEAARVPSDPDLEGQLVVVAETPQGVIQTDTHNVDTSGVYTDIADWVTGTLPMPNDPNAPLSVSIYALVTAGITNDRVGVRSWAIYAEPR